MSNKILFFLLFVLFCCLFLTSNNVLAIEKIKIPNPLCLHDKGQQDAENCIETIPQFIKKIGDYVFGLIGVLSVIMFIWSGVLFVISAGNEDRLKKARAALTYAFIGAAIALGGKGFIEVIANFTGKPNP